MILKLSQSLLRQQSRYGNIDVIRRNSNSSEVQVNKKKKNGTTLKLESENICDCSDISS